MKKSKKIKFGVYFIFNYLSFICNIFVLFVILLFHVHLKEGRKKKENKEFSFILFYLFYFNFLNILFSYIVLSWCVNVLERLAQKGRSLNMKKSGSTSYFLFWYSWQQHWWLPIGFCSKSWRTIMHQVLNKANLIVFPRNPRWGTQRWRKIKIKNKRILLLNIGDIIVETRASSTRKAIGSGGKRTKQEEVQEQPFMLTLLLNQW